MNIREAHDACHEIIMLAPDYVIREGTQSTFILVSVSGNSENIYIGSFLIDPSMPQAGNLLDFTQLTTEQQVAVLSLPQISDLVGNQHSELEEVIIKANKTDNTAVLMRWLEEKFNRFVARRNG